MSNEPKFSVVIPFYQKESGILAKALRSIEEQGYPHDALHVLIVDDGSPISCEEEVSRSGLSKSVRTTIIRQANAGPNEARNAALEHLDPDTDYVAYLDSDDEWIGQHLERAALVLSKGYSAYFSNLFHLGDTVPEFEKAGRVKFAEHLAIGDETLREYVGDMTRQVVTANIIFMPSLVVDARSMGHVRFPLSHRHGGGDYLYWLELIAAGARFAFSTLPEVRCGRGVNLWYGSGWGTDGFAARILDETRFRTKAANMYVTDAHTRAALKRRIAELRVLYVQDAVHRMKRGQKVDWKSFILLFREGHTSLPMMLSVGLQEAKSLVKERSFR